MGPQSRIAFLKHQDHVFYARCNPEPHAPNSAITRLIQGIYSKEPDQARKILRNRIYTNEVLGEMSLGMVKVAAKTVSPLQSTPPEPTPDWTEVFPPSAQCLKELPPGLNERMAKSPSDFMKIARDLARTIPREGTLYACDRPVAALLVSAAGEILASAVNTNARNRTLHAEINLVQGYFENTGRPIPRDATIYTTLKSCKMCAGMIWDACEEITSIRIYYGEDDPGPQGRRTVFTPGSFERKRACKNQTQLMLQVEYPLENP